MSDSHVSIMQEPTKDSRGRAVWVQRAVCPHGLDFLVDTEQPDPENYYAHTAEDGCQTTTSHSYPRTILSPE